ncbi:peptide ligase PGM1-related protein [Streptomyces sp. NPDC048639]|uniref:preATP grasp domain-containing protein n=1 Tax=Streptomyces sp. NPDC048639 TaxID=3365581 RepID=UPI003723F20E
MAKLIISNQRTEEMVGDLQILSPEYRTYVGNQAQRMAWCLQEGDVLVLPVMPDEHFIDYVIGSLRIAREEIDIIVPPSGKCGDGILSRDRLMDPQFVAQLQESVREHDVGEVLPFHFDSTVVALSKILKLDGLTPGFAFLDQGGGRLLNSKATFRALAGGTGVPVPHGKVCSSQEEANEFLWEELLSRGYPAIVKRDFHVAGFGNEVVSPMPGVDPIGALRTVVTADRNALANYLAERWHWLTDLNRSPVVLERYFPDSLPLCAELHISDGGTELTGHGAMRMDPVLNGHVWPAPAAELPGFEVFLAVARRMCEPIHAMGYRGVVSVDAIVTSDQGILVNEFNCRVSGSTHAYSIGEHIVGGNFLAERVLVEQRRCTFPPSATMVKALTSSGLAYDHATRVGVLMTVEDNSTSGEFGEYCIVAENAEHAERLEAALAEVLASIQK